MAQRWKPISAWPRQPSARGSAWQIRRALWWIHRHRTQHRARAEMVRAVRVGHEPAPSRVGEPGAGRLHNRRPCRLCRRDSTYLIPILLRFAPAQEPLPQKVRENREQGKLKHAPPLRLVCLHWWGFSLPTLAGAFFHTFSGSGPRGLERFAADQVLVILALPDDAPGGAFHQHFRRAGARVVIRTQHEAIGSGGRDREEIAGHGIGHGAIAGQEIAGFADGSHDIHGDARQRVLAQREDLVVRAIERRSDEIVHRGVDNQEFLLAIALAVEDTSQQHAGGTGDAAARFDDGGEAARVEPAGQGLHEGPEFRAGFLPPARRAGGGGARCGSGREARWGWPRVKGPPLGPKSPPFPPRVVPPGGGKTGGFSRL